MDRVERSKHGLLKRASGFEQTTVQREECDGVKNLAGPLDENVEWKASVIGRSSSDGPRHFGEDKLARYKVRIRDELAQRRALGFVSNELHKGRGIGVQECQLSVRRGSR